MSTLPLFAWVPSTGWLAGLLRPSLFRTGVVVRVMTARRRRLAWTSVCGLGVLLLAPVIIPDRLRKACSDEVEADC